MLLVVIAFATLPVLIPTIVIVRPIDLVLVVALSGFILRSSIFERIVIPVQPLLAMISFGVIVVTSLVSQAFLLGQPVIMSDVFAVMRVVRVVGLIVVAATVFRVAKWRYAFNYYVLLATGIAAIGSVIWTGFLMANIETVYTLSGVFAADQHIYGAAEKFRVFGTTGNPNSFASLLIPGIILSLMIIITGEREEKNRTLSWVAGPAAVISLLLTQSRTGLAALLGAFVVSLVAIGYSSDRLSLKWGITGGVGGAIGLLGVSSVVLPRPTSVLLRPWTADTMQSRFRRWSNLVATSEWHAPQMLLGHGPSEAFLHKYPPVDGELVLVLFRYGVVGLIAFILFWAFVFRSCVLEAERSRSPVAITGAATAVVALLFSITGNSYHNLQVMTYFAMVIGAAYGRIADGE